MTIRRAVLHDATFTSDRPATLVCMDVGGRHLDCAVTTTGSGEAIAYFIELSADLATWEPGSVPVGAADPLPRVDVDLVPACRACQVTLPHGG